MPATTKQRPAKRPTSTVRAAALANKAGLKVGLVDKALAARWAETISRLRAARGEATKGWDDKYEAVGEILDHKLYLAGSHKSAREFLAKELPGEDERSVRTYMRVARYFDPADEEKYGISRLDLLLTYLEAAGGAPLAPAKINLAKSRIKVVDKKAVHTIDFAEVTVEQLRLAVRGARSDKGPAKAKEPPAVKALRAHFVKSGLRSVGVRLRGDRYDFSGVQQGDLARLAKALSTAKVPV